MEQNHCGRETCNFNYEGVASADYDSMYEFWLGEALDIDNDSDCGPWGFDDNSEENHQIFYQLLYDYDNPPPLPTGSVVGPHKT